ncbi:hypothetical protein [Methylibium sp.]|uniref:hypothetical protein n=1 Tax=Methylibium sp. TaxID=2067992 RepID=UPI00286B303C|nr:hypothetical protein [Methylibium sp.]
MDPKSAPSPSSSLPPLDDPLIRMLAKSIRHAVRILAVMMVLVIWWGVADVAYVLFERISNHPYTCSTSATSWPPSAPSWRC